MYLEQVLSHAQQVGLMSDEHSYIFLSPDLFTLDLSPYRYGGVNITGRQILNLCISAKEIEFEQILLIRFNFGIIT